MEAGVQQPFLGPALDLGVFFPSSEFSTSLCHCLRDGKVVRGANLFQNALNGDVLLFLGAPSLQSLRKRTTLGVVLFHFPRQIFRVKFLSTLSFEDRLLQHLVSFSLNSSQF